MKIQKWLLPHKANKYHPYILRPLGLGLVVAALLGLNLVQNLASAQSFQVLGVATSISSSEIISLSNQERASNGLSGLSYNAKLASAAQAKARDMFAKDYWAHYAPDGTSPWYFIDQVGYAYTTAGENLAKDFDTSAGVVQGWMNSSAHRANILNSSFKETGVAVMDGTLQGTQTTLVVALYAAPHAVSAPAPTAAAPTTSTPKPSPKSVAAPAAPAPTEIPVPVPAAPADEPAPTQSAAKPPETPTAEAAASKPATSDIRSLEEQSVSVRQSRTWAQNASLLLISTLFLISVLKHTVVWRVHKKHLRHIWLRAHPGAQYAILLVAIAANVATGTGVVR